MTTLIVKFGQTIGEMYDAPSMREGDKLFLDGGYWEVTQVMHFLDVKDIKEYVKFKAPFIRYLIRPINF